MYISNTTIDQKATPEICLTELHLPETHQRPFTGNSSETTYRKLIRDHLLETHQKPTYGKLTRDHLRETHQKPTYGKLIGDHLSCLLYTSPSPRDLSTSRMPSSA